MRRRSGGTISGEGIFDTGDRSYTAHLVTDGVQLARLRTDADAPLPEGMDGALHADLGHRGTGGRILPHLRSTAVPIS